NRCCRGRGNLGASEQSRVTHRVVQGILMTSAKSACISAAKVHSAVALALLLVGCATAAALDCVAVICERLADWMYRLEQETCRMTKGVCSNSGYFVDSVDKLMLDELPRAD